MTTLRSPQEPQAAAAAGGHGDPKKMVRTYLAIFGALAVLTFLTVWVNTLDVSRPVAIAIAGSIAIVKVALIAMFFMHLKSEGRWIFGVVALCLIAVLILAVLISPDIGGVFGGFRH
ncbi:cytochrome C oxidase subunit IV family protein [bacterium]|nr:cytochrome C oxidase subunit IV family protein [bacterium]